jgi:hypothetical protein
MVDDDVDEIITLKLMLQKRSVCGLNSAILGRNLGELL